MCAAARGWTRNGIFVPSPSPHCLQASLRACHGPREVAAVSRTTSVRYLSWAAAGCRTNAASSSDPVGCSQRKNCYMDAAVLRGSLTNTFLMRHPFRLVANLGEPAQGYDSTKVERVRFKIGRSKARCVPVGALKINLKYLVDGNHGECGGLYRVRVKAS